MAKINSKSFLTWTVLSTSSFFEFSNFFIYQLPAWRSCESLQQNQQAGGKNVTRMFKNDRGYKRLEESQLNPCASYKAI
jgi:hypothetical protein